MYIFSISLKSKHNSKYNGYSFADHFTTTIEYVDGHSLPLAKNHHAWRPPSCDIALQDFMHFHTQDTLRCIDHPYHDLLEKTPYSYHRRTLLWGKGPLL